MTKHIFIVLFTLSYAIFPNVVHAGGVSTTSNEEQVTNKVQESPDVKALRNKIKFIREMTCWDMPQFDNMSDETFVSQSKAYIRIFDNLLFSYKVKLEVEGGPQSYDGTPYCNSNFQGYDASWRTHTWFLPNLLEDNQTIKFHYFANYRLTEMSFDLVDQEMGINKLAISTSQSPTKYNNIRGPIIYVLGILQYLGRASDEVTTIRIKTTVYPQVGDNSSPMVNFP